VYRLNNSVVCHPGPEAAAEDVEIGKCLSNLNVSAMDTRDSNGRGRFFPLALDKQLTLGKSTKDFWIYSFYPFTVVKYHQCLFSFIYINQPLNGPSLMAGFIL